MSQFRLANLLLTPSILSAIVTITSAVVATAYSGWSYINDAELFYDYLFGPLGVVTALLSTPDPFMILRIAIFNNPLTYNALILLCAIIIGFIVYEILESSQRVVRESTTVWYELHSPTPEARQAMYDTLVRLCVRTAGFVGWMLYTLLFINILAPFCLVLLQVGIDDIASSMLTGWLYGFIAYALLALGLHLHIVFLRLCLLRPRIFGGIDILMAELD